MRTVVASDFSPGRRALATRVRGRRRGRPAQGFAVRGRAAGQGHLTRLLEAFDLAVGLDGEAAAAAARGGTSTAPPEPLGAATPKRPVIFECVGVPGVIDGIIAGAPLFSRVVVVGVCMGADRIRPAMAINKEIDLRFVLGYTPLEFRDTLHMLADGKVNAAPLVTGDGRAGRRRQRVRRPRRPRDAREDPHRPQERR